MPVLYTEFTKPTPEEVASGEVQKSKKLWQAIESPYMLVQIPEPDFSMVFNVNGVTFAVLGILIVNIYNTLVKPKRFL